MELDFDKLNGLVPAVIQDYNTEKMLMLGFMNKEAYKKTRKTGLVTFYSRTRNKLWTKGETSKNYLHVKYMREDCDNDTLLIKAVPDGDVCHLGRYSCFAEPKTGNVNFLMELEGIIQQRKRDLPEGSYTSKLFGKGINKIAQKVGEEAVELLIEAKDDNKELFLNEAADLLYHLEVLLTQKGYSMAEVVDVLKKRHQ